MRGVFYLGSSSLGLRAALGRAVVEMPGWYARMECGEDLEAGHAGLNCFPYLTHGAGRNRTSQYVVESVVNV